MAQIAKAMQGGEGNGNKMNQQWNEAQETDKVIENESLVLSLVIVMLPLDRTLRVLLACFELPLTSPPPLSSVNNATNSKEHPKW